LAGLPPLAGFFGKFYVLMNSFHTGNWGLVFLGVVTSLVSAYYYLRIVKAMWFEKVTAGETFTEGTFHVAQAGKAYFYQYTKNSGTYKPVLYLALSFIFFFLLINSPILTLTYQLALSCSLADGWSGLSTI
jgi:NADH:ubiquinone oxidoreductase subunit 2 (subunit N)